MSQDPWVYGEKVTYACDPGYRMISGDFQRTCYASGEWSGEIPICKCKYASNT